MPSRGEVWLVDLGMIQKVRPALILSRSFKDEDRALISVIPHTTSLRGSDLEIRFTVPFLQPGAFLAQNPITTLRRRTCPPWRPARRRIIRLAQEMKAKPTCRTGVPTKADLSRHSALRYGGMPTACSWRGFQCPCLSECAYRPTFELR